MSTPRRRPFRSSKARSDKRSGAGAGGDGADADAGAGNSAGDGKSLTAQAAEARRLRRQIVVSLQFLESSYHPRICVVTGQAAANEGNAWAEETVQLQKRKVSINQAQHERSDDRALKEVALWFSDRGWRSMKIYQWLLGTATGGLGLTFMFGFMLSHDFKTAQQAWMLVPMLAIFGAVGWAAWLYRRSHQLPKISRDSNPQRVRIAFPEHLQSVYDAWSMAVREWHHDRVTGKIKRHARGGKAGVDEGAADDYDDAGEDVSASWDEGSKEG